MKLQSLLMASTILFLSCSKTVLPEPELELIGSSKNGAAKTMAGEPLIGYANVNGTTTGGAGGATVTVTNFNDLKNAATGSATPLIIQVSGTITGSEIIHTQSNKSFIGLQGSSIVGAAIGVYAGKSNVIFQNMTIKDVVGYTNIIVTDGAHHVWIDHCDLSSDRDHGWDYYDSLIDIGNAADYITISWNKLHDSHIPVLIGFSDQQTGDIGHLRTTLHHNYFYNVSERQPSTRFGYMHVFNNYILNSSGYGIGSTMGAIVRTDNNYFENANVPIRTTYNAAPGYISGESTNIAINSNANQITTAPSSWTPAGDYSYSSWLTSATQAKIDVLAGAGPNFSTSAPTITSHPSSQTVSVGANVTFSVTASGTPTLTYQWKKNGTNIGGATSSTLNLTNVQTTAAGNYTVAVTNTSGTVTSNIAVLTVNSGGSGPTYQAENAVLTGGSVIESTNAGWNGTGYVNSSMTGGAIQFNNVDGLGGGTKTLTIRYANGVAAMTGQLVINGGTPVNLTTPTTGSWTTWTTMNVTVTLNNNSTNTIRLQTNGQDLGNIDEITISTPAAPNTYQAENGTLTGGDVFESSNAGWNGTGYVNSSTTGGSMQFNNVDGLGGGTKTLTIRYANGVAAMTGQLVVNGGTPVNITTPTTGSWTTWATMNVTITLNNNSTNTIRLQTNGQDLGNIDEITISTPATPDTYQAESGTLAGGAVIESSFTGFNGTGYVNPPTTGGSVQINNVDGNGGGSKTITIRYSLLAAPSRVAQLVINGGTPINITAAATGSWSTWGTVTANITLNNNSTNTIKIQTNGQDWGMVDQILVP